MTQANMIPAVWVSRLGKRVQAVAALALSSVLAAELLRGVEEGSGGDGAAMVQGQGLAQASLLQAVAAWPANTSMELHWTALPDLKMPSNGRLWVTLFLRAVAKDREAATTDVLESYFRLKPLLPVFFRHLAFAPVEDVEALRQRLAPFGAAGAVAIGRQQKRIALGKPVAHTSLGFGPLKSGAVAEQAIDHRFPWVASGAGTDGLVRALMQQLNPTQWIVRVAPASAKAAALETLRAEVQACDRFLGQGHTGEVTLMEQAQGLRMIALRQLVRLTEAGLKVGVFWVGAAPMNGATASVFTHMLLAATSALGGDQIHAGGFCARAIRADKARDTGRFGRTPISAGEAAAAFQLPTAPLHDLPGLPILRWRTCPATLEDDGEPDAVGITLFDNVHQGVAQPIRLSNEDRLRHMAVFGATGTGKSTYMANMIVADIVQGRGVTVIDPHGSLVESILPYIPEARRQDVVLFDVTDRERPIGFNPLEWETIQERDLIIEEIYACLEVMYDFKQTGGPVFENNYRKMMTLLCGDEQSRGSRNGFVGTVLDLTRCYQDEQFRRFLGDTIADRDVKEFLTELERSRGEAQLANISPYVTSKFGRFTSDTALKRIFGQERSRIDFNAIIGENRIFLVKLGRGDFGESVCGLLCTMLLTRLKMAAMKRGPLASAQGREHFIYVDESGLVPGHVIAGLLSEIRKYGIGIVLGSQYTKQLTSAVANTRKDTLLDSVHGNVGTMVVFRMGKEDAREMSALFWPSCGMLDIMRLPNFCGYCKMSAGSQSLPPFSFRSRPLDPIGRHDQADAIREQSRRRYGISAELVDDLLVQHRKLQKADA